MRNRSPAEYNLPIRLLNRISEVRPDILLEFIDKKVYVGFKSLEKEIKTMPTSAGITIMKMIESLPQPLQEIALEHMQQYIEVIRDELKWSQAFENSQSKLVAAARQAREEIARGKATPLNIRDL